MPNAVIAGFSRSPFTISFKGEFKSLRPEDILAEVINHLIDKTKIGNKTDHITGIVPLLPKDVKKNII